MLIVEVIPISFTLGDNLTLTTINADNTFRYMFRQNTVYIVSK